MKHGRTLQELAMELDRQARTKKDYLIDTSLLSMRLEDDAPVLHFPANELSHSGILHINDIAHRQIGQSLGIPAKYYDKMRTENPELLVANVNSWFDTTPQTRMVRTLDDTARAFLSNRYRCIDNYEVVETVLPIIGAMKGASVQSCELTDRRMYIKVVSDRITAEISKGDVVQAGLVISNSEVGMGSVNVRPLIYRLVCSNGMIAEDSGVRKYHVGRANESDNVDYSIYRDETIEADDKAFLMKIEDVVKAAVTEAVFAKLVDKMRAATDARIEASAVPTVVELTSKEFGINQAESSGILGHLINGGDLSLYGLANAITRQAHDVDSYDRSTELEALGYKVMTMPCPLWKRIAAAG